MDAMDRSGIVRTDRLVLRPVSESDVPALTDLRMLAPVREFLGGELPAEIALAKALACVASPDHYAVVRQDEQRIIGVVSLTPRGTETELSYEFMPDAWGHGFAMEACVALLDRSTPGDGDGHLIAVTQQANRRSRSLLERLGMTVREAFVEYGAPQVLYTTTSGLP